MNARARCRQTRATIISFSVDVAGGGLLLVGKCAESRGDVACAIEAG
jgi:hypothetical protein